MGKLGLLMLFLSLFLTSSLAIRYTNPDPHRDFKQCVERCEEWKEHGTGGSKGQHDCHHQCRKWFGEETGLSLVDDDNQGRQCEMVCEKHGSEPWKCKRSCKDIELLGEVELDENNQGRECEMVCEKHGSEPWKCKRSCKDIELGDNPRQGRHCETVCERHGSKPWECKKSCKDMELGDKDVERFAKCQQKCVGKADDKCLTKCVRESHSQRQRRGGSAIDLVQLSR